MYELYAVIQNWLLALYEHFIHVCCLDKCMHIHEHLLDIPRQQTCMKCSYSASNQFCITAYSSYMSCLGNKIQCSCSAQPRTAFAQCTATTTCTCSLYMYMYVLVYVHVLVHVHVMCSTCTCTCTLFPYRATCS